MRIQNLPNTVYKMPKYDRRNDRVCKNCGRIVIIDGETIASFQKRDGRYFCASCLIRNPEI